MKLSAIIPASKAGTLPREVYNYPRAALVYYRVESVRKPEPLGCEARDANFFTCVACRLSRRGKSLFFVFPGHRPATFSLS